MMEYFRGNGEQKEKWPDSNQAGKYIHNFFTRIAICYFFSNTNMGYSPFKPHFSGDFSSLL
jgi:hypothetical protein